MTPKPDRAYLLSRLKRNRELAERSSQPSVRNIHQQYVRFYRKLLNGGA